MPLQRFYNATDKLINAFIMGNLHHNDGCSCAIGNLCNGSNEWVDYHIASWRKEWAAELMGKTGYAIPEIYEIERQFEDRPCLLLKYPDHATPSSFYAPNLNIENDRDGFKGLCNVFDYMVSIEDWSDEYKKVNLIEMCLNN